MNRELLVTSETFSMKPCEFICQFRVRILESRYINRVLIQMLVNLSKNESSEVEGRMMYKDTYT